MSRFLLALLAVFSPAAAYADGIAEPWQLGFQESASPVMEQLAWLHDKFLLYIITAITIFVLVAMVFIALRFNRRANPVASKTTHNVKLEVIWTVVPVLILIAIAVPSVRIHNFMEKMPDGGLTLKVTGYQWYWGYEYPDNGGINFESRIVEDKDLKEGDVRLLSVDNAVVVPVNTPVRVQTTAADVIHAWALPAFGVKRDAVPGRLNETWFEATKEGRYYGQCSELCGIKHGFMPIVVDVVSKEKFEAWVKEKQITR
ncbi:MAG: cytochrome c oxidase subunit II [Alphaproteobacteria bacterium]|nr:cytochrome c oxidase subunit II [Alphaproteobacteria bacterium]